MRQVRSAVGPTFPVSVKLNSADFQRAGFAIQFWYYAQIDSIGRTGKPRLSQSPLSGMMQVERQSRAWLAARGA